MKIAFSSEAFLDFQNWSREDKKLFSKICAIIKDVERSPFHGLGKPEPLKHTLSGFWSRRINQEHRLVYKVEKDTIFIASCKYHY
jgi:toxin YoeB